MVTKTAIDQLPSLPQVLVQILDAIQSDNADYQRVAEIIRHDTGVATKLISVANSSYYSRPQRCESVERALLFLGTDVVKTIVITASIKQFFGQFNQQHNQFLKHFWRRSLISANFAQVLASLTSYPAPDEAYLCGLLTDVGQLMLLTQDDKQYLKILSETEGDNQLLAAEQEQYAQTHSQLGAELIGSWEIAGFMADAVRYHHEPDNLLLDAHHLVKIVNLSSLLSGSDTVDDQALATANTLFGLNESLTLELRSRINADIDNIASSLGIDISETEQASQQQHEAHRQLGQRLGDLGELAQINASLGQARSQQGLNQAAQRSLFLTLGISNSVLFLLDEENQQLHAQPSTGMEPSDTQKLDFQIPLTAGRSLISDSYLQNQQLTSSETEHTLSVVDRQLLRYCQSDILLCWPLLTSANDPTQTKKIGVLVFGCNEKQLKQLKQRSGLAQNLCTEIASAIVNNQHRFDDINEEGPSAREYQQNIREAIHEASNPLSIIRNYLEMLRIKLGDEHSANEGLGLIKEEIDRVGNILLRLRDPEQSSQGDETLDINAIIEATTQIFTDSVCATKQLALELKLDGKLNEINGNPEHLKQILTNLLKNAVEALDPGGKITVSSEASISVNGRDYAAINIEDNGPGITDEIKRNLFQPVNSTKGQEHSGLGLSIVKKLVEDMDGSIVCRSNSGSGTLFQVLLPK